MLTRDDMIEVFETFRIGYGNQWKQGPKAVDTYRDALGAYSMDEIKQAVNRAMSVHVKHPPTLPELLLILRTIRSDQRSPKRERTPSMPRIQVVANRVMLHVIRRSLGVPGDISRMVDLKNALVDDFGSDEPTKDFVADLNRELTDFVDNARRMAAR